MAGCSLPPADDVRAADPRVRSIKSPRLTGWLLRLVVWILESALGTLLLNRMWRRSGIQQALRETDVPEQPTFEPTWPHPEDSDAGINIEELDAPTRASVAAHTIPGFSAVREAEEGSKRRRRWEVADYAQAYKTRLATPLDVARSILDSLAASEAAEPPMRFLISQDSEDLLSQARESAARHAEGKALSPLDGVPYAVIDGLDALPYPTSAGTTYLAADRPVLADAPAVAALRRAGALLVGKTTVHELGIGMTGLNPATGTARNPYDPRRCAGGSSSGSAAIVSAGICAFALGIDGGGSVRVPAALCGVVALKPTSGRTSRRGCPPTAFSIMSCGPLTASVGDAMLVNAVISNAGTSDLRQQPAPTTITRSLFDDRPGSGGDGKPLRGKKIGVFFAWVEAAAPGVLAAFNRAVKTAARLGAEIVETQIPELELVRVAQMAAIGCEIAQACKAAHADPGRRRQMNLETRVTLASTSRFLATDFLQAQKIRTRLMTHMRRLFKEVDCIACPTVGITAPEISEAAARGGESDMALTGELMRFTIPVNMSGTASLTLPVGQDLNGLPVGLQLIGRPWREAELLFVGSALESAMREQLRLPMVSFDVLYGPPH